ncbi:Zn-dependent hydrolase, including glyoxylase [Archaeoglobus sulfaticallidus PM70-1]|uniref:Zn-dependent hydrolase, including glyoxylase n=2 Tax=Archaeoglobus TaxID=2233 RepID=N0BAJ6_9EURY|nr:Zn-dependent hydrolase, including glyoxylase [Archaeoglobus sulfaticallidus PM70-1]
MLLDKLYAYVWGSAFMDSSNTYIIRDEVTFIIDPGCYKSFTNLFGLMNNDRIPLSDVDVVFNTHLHKDHCESNSMFLRKGAILAFNINDRVIRNEKPDLDVSKIKHYSTGKLDLEFIHTPGHTPGSTCIYINEFDALISGDLVFENGLPGRTDLHGSNNRDMIKSLEKIHDLSPELILPGHGRIFSGREGIRALLEKSIEFITRKDNY